MKLELKSYGALCSTEIFKINNIEAEADDFGEKYDRDQDNAEDYCCGDMKFTRIEPKQEVLDKYKITTEEYAEICEKLEDILSFGCCGWCS